MKKTLPVSSLCSHRGLTVKRNEKEETMIIIIMEREISLCFAKDQYSGCAHVKKEKSVKPLEFNQHIIPPLVAVAVGPDRK